MSKNSEWSNSVVVITGAGSGIGRAIAREAAKRGAIVMVTDINPEKAKQTAIECGHNSQSFVLDVCNSEDFKMMIDLVIQKYGKIDYLFNNAGIAIGGETFEITLQAWNKIIDVNVRGVINGIAAVYPQMVKQKSGHIINTASLAGLGPAPLLTPYSTTKHAIVGLSTSLRSEAEIYGVKISVLCPSAIETPLLDSKEVPGLPIVPWLPDFRRFLTKLAGPPYSPEKLAEDTLNAISKNQGIIVIPQRAKAVWHIGKLFPKLVEKTCADALAIERADRK